METNKKKQKRSKKTELDELLPAEIWNHILSFLHNDLKSLARASLVSRQLSDIIRADQQLSEMLARYVWLQDKHGRPIIGDIQITAVGQVHIGKTRIIANYTQSELRSPHDPSMDEMFYKNVKVDENTHTIKILDTVN
eukprot:TRINITY_DN13613_c0_g1_i1.p1 TRINITY_DN13613_c0_g1~~TRINITY_DN13613_c0_g1_i1.p1  ORF type:complete len:138 (+),score=3.39 TRINITY_DN13613_c0_g1_i1:55-468(+)